MSRTGPDAALDLVAIALETLRADLLPSLPPEKRYTALMIANALSVAQRELREGEAARRTMLEALQGLLGGHPPGKEADLDAAVQCLLRKLATGLPRMAIPLSKLESGAQVPAFELAGAKRRTGRTLAARAFLGPADDIRARSVAGQYCNAGASARSGLEPRAAL